MNKKKLLGFSIIILALFSALPKLMDAAFVIVTTCQPPMTTFSDGNPTFEISFPPGGGTTCDTIADCPKISLPANGTVFSVKLDMEITNPASEIGTPYVWVPVSEGADKDHIKQIDSSDCSIIESYPTGDNPSRTFVIPGGDVWVANRDSGNVTKLSPLAGDQPAGGTCEDGLCGTDEDIYSCPADCSGSICGLLGTQDCRKYEVAGNYATGGGPRGITGDISGNVWVGNRDGWSISKLDSATGAKLIADIAVAGGSYGIVGDPYGHIWSSNRSAGSLQCLDSVTNAITTVDTITLPYGIGMGKDGSIYTACYECGTVLKYNPVSGNCPAVLVPSATYDTGVVSGTRGVAVDQNDYVWIANSGNSTLYMFTDPATSFSVIPGGTNLIGAAVDFDGYGWTVSYNSGDVYKYSFDGASLNLECSVNINGNPYNYSDMTGLRTIPKNLTAGSISSIPLSTTDTFTICTDGIEDCNDPLSNSAPCAIITAFLAACAPDAMGDCEIPLEIFSMQVGDYTLKNLEVVYGKEVPVTTGGLVPCGRDWDDPSTTWIETDDCNFCFLMMMVNDLMNFLIMIVSAVAVLALITTGLMFITSSGDSERKNQAKTTFKYVLIGYIILFTSWIVVDFLLIAWGYLDPLGGEWNVICD